VVNKLRLALTELLIGTLRLLVAPKSYFKAGLASENSRLERDGLYLVAVEPGEIGSSLHRKKYWEAWGMWTIPGIVIAMFFALYQTAI
jgi:hypothetical protein